MSADRVVAHQPSVSEHKDGRPRAAASSWRARRGASAVRVVDRRLCVLLRREGWVVNQKRVYRIYREEGLEVRTKKRRRKRASHVRLLVPPAQRPNERWSMDFVTDRLESGRSFRVLTVVDQFSRECPLLEPGVSMTGKTVARQATRATVVHASVATGASRSTMARNSTPRRWTPGRTEEACSWSLFGRESRWRMRLSRVSTDVFETNASTPICSSRSMTRAENWRLGGSITIPNGHTAH